jgi:hypothetical protein
LSNRWFADVVVSAAGVAVAAAGAAAAAAPSSSSSLLSARPWNIFEFFERCCSSSAASRTPSRPLACAAAPAARHRGGRFNTSSSGAWLAALCWGHSPRLLSTSWTSTSFTLRNDWSRHVRLADWLSGWFGRLGARLHGGLQGGATEKIAGRPRLNSGASPFK